MMSRWTRVSGVIGALLLAASTAYAAEKASEKVSPFYGSLSHAIPIDVPGFRGLEPKLALSYTSEGRNGFVGVGWSLSGVTGRFLVPVGNNGLAVYKLAANGTAKLKTVLIAR